MASQAALPKRALGNTGLHLSVLGFGAGVLGGVFEDVQVDQQQANAAVHRAFELGINFFDTSPYYGATKSEKVLGEALKGLPRDQVVLSTKLGRYGVDTFDFSAARVETSVQESLQRLQVDYLDVLLCHDVEFGDLVQVVNETLPACQSLKARGLVKAIGFSCLPLNTIKYILDRVPPGTVDCVLSYCHNSLNDGSLITLLPYLQSKGVGVIGASPFSMGLLTPQGPSSWHPAPAELRLACAEAAKLAQAEGVPITHLALSHAVREAGVSSTLVGMGTVGQVEENVVCVQRALGLVDNPAAELEGQVLEQVKQLLQPVMGVTWPQGHPAPAD